MAHTLTVDLGTIVPYLPEYPACQLFSRRRGDAGTLEHPIFSGVRTLTVPANRSSFDIQIPASSEYTASQEYMLAIGGREYVFVMPDADVTLSNLLLRGSTNLPPVLVQEVAPIDAIRGELWIKASTQILYYYSGTNWVEPSHSDVPASVRDEITEIKRIADGAVQVDGIELNGRTITFPDDGGSSPAQIEIPGVTVKEDNLPKGTTGEITEFNFTGNGVDVDQTGPRVNVHITGEAGGTGVSNAQVTQNIDGRLEGFADKLTPNAKVPDGRLNQASGTQRGTIGPDEFAKINDAVDAAHLHDTPHLLNNQLEDLDAVLLDDASVTDGDGSQLKEISIRELDKRWKNDSANVIHDNTLEGNGTPASKLKIDSDLVKQIDENTDALRLLEHETVFDTAQRGDDFVVGTGANGQESGAWGEDGTSASTANAPTFEVNGVTYRVLFILDNRTDLLEIWIGGATDSATEAQIPAFPATVDFEINDVDFRYRDAEPGSYSPQTGGQPAYRNYFWRDKHNTLNLGTGNTLIIKVPNEGSDNTRILPKPPAEDGYIPVSEGGKWVAEHQHDATFSEETPDPGHPLKFAVVERAGPKAVTLAYDGESDANVWHGDIHINLDYNATLRLPVTGSNDPSPLKWSLTFNTTGAAPTANDVWGKTPKSFEIIYPGTNRKTTVPIELDSSIANALAYIAETALASNPAEFGSSPSQDDTESVDFNILFTDGSRAYPVAETVVQRAATITDARALLREQHIQSVTVSGNTATFRVVASTGAVSSVAVNLAGSTASGVTLDAVGALLAALDQFTYDTGTNTLAFALAAGDVSASNLDTDTESKKKSFRDAIGIGAVPSGSTPPANPAIGQRFLLSADAEVDRPGVLKPVQSTTPSGGHLIGWYRGISGELNPLPTNIDAIQYYANEAQNPQQLRGRLSVVRSNSTSKTPASIAVGVDGTNQALTNAGAQYPHNWITGTITDPFVVGQIIPIQIRYTDGTIEYARVSLSPGIIVFVAFHWISEVLHEDDIADIVKPQALIGNTDSWSLADCSIRVMTEAAYQALTTPDPNTLYLTT